MLEQTKITSVSAMDDFIEAFVYSHGSKKIIQIYAKQAATGSSWFFSIPGRPANPFHGLP
jgi:hypothetical protein